MKRTEEELKALNLLFKENTKRLTETIKPIQQSKYEADFDWIYIDKQFTIWADDYGPVDLNPDFQRGHVWTEEQQLHFIENVLRGLVSTSGFMIQMNCPNWETDKVVTDLPFGMQCIDGLQRLTAVREFLKGNIKPFGLTPDDLLISKFSIKTNFRWRIAMYNFTKKSDLIGHYLDINTGGTPHSKEEIDRVKKMKASLE